MSAKDEIVDAWKQHLSSGKGEPKTLKLPLVKAHDLCKLGHEALGDLSCELLRYGPYHLEKTGIFGLNVDIIKNGDIEFE